jgi:Domain of unknown function (DUF4349)
MSAIDRNELDGYEALVSELRATAPVAPESLRERVLEGAPAPRRRRSRRRRLFLVVVPVAVVLAVGAAVVHGFVNSGSNSQSLEPALKEARLSPSAAGGLASHSVQRKTVPHGENAYSADQAGQNEALGSLGAPAAVGSSPERLVTIPKNRIVHATASLEVQVTNRSDLSQQTNKASQIVGSLGGYAQSVHYQANHHGAGAAVLELRVPVQNAQAAIGKLSTLGKLLSQQVSTQDLQAKLTQQTTGIGSLRRAIAVYEAALQSTTLPASQRATLQIRLNNARRQLSRLQHARKGTLASGATASISLLLTTRNGAAVITHHHGSTRIGRLLGSAAHFLALEGIIVLYALIVLAPFLLLGGLGWWILRERRRREDRLLAGTS